MSVIACVKIVKQRRDLMLPAGALCVTNGWSLGLLSSVVCKAADSRIFEKHRPT